jgi:hypothetical protein
MELEDLMNESIEKLEGNFYSKKFYFSYSSLNKLIWNPAVFHQLYILGLKEEKQDAHLVQGKVIHALLLEPENFQDNFIVSPGNLPTGNPKIVIDRVFAHHIELSRNGDERTMLPEFMDAILDIMKDMNYHQSLKTDQQRLDKILTPESENYWNFLKAKGNKTLLDQETYDFCYNAVELIKTNKELCSLLACDINDFDNKQVYNELPLMLDLPNRIFGLKGIVDNLVIDHDQKILYINDVKTTSKDLKDFPETVEFYSYWMQAVIYCTLVSLHFANLMSVGYKVKFHFVVIDRMFQTYAFPVQESTLNEWADRLVRQLDRAEWHYTNKSYDLPYEFATGSITL